MTACDERRVKVNVHSQDPTFQCWHVCMLQDWMRWTGLCDVRFGVSWEKMPTNNYWDFEWQKNFISRWDLITINTQTIEVAWKSYKTCIIISILSASGKRMNFFVRFVNVSKWNPSQIRLQWTLEWTMWNQIWLNQTFCFQASILQISRLSWEVPCSLYKKPKIWGTNAFIHDLFMTQQLTFSLSDFRLSWECCNDFDVMSLRWEPVISDMAVRPSFSIMDNNWAEYITMAWNWPP